MKRQITGVLIAIVFLVAARLVIAAFTPVFEPSEARYAAMSGNMAGTGDFLVPHYTYNDAYQSFDGKPPLLFQLGGLSVKAFGRHAIAVRLPVIVATILMLALVYVAVRRLGGDAVSALLAAAISLTCAGYYAIAGICMADGLLVPCVAGAILCHAVFVKTRNPNWTLGVFALLGVGMVVKGPVAIALFGIGAFFDACFNGRWRLLLKYRWFSGLLLFLAIASPWYVLVSQKTPGFLKYFFINENLLRFLVHDYGDKYGSGRETFRGMALIWALVVTLPWSPVFIWERIKGTMAKVQVADMAVKYRDITLSPVGWGIVGIIGFWCLTSRVPVAYLMPIVPLAATWFAMKTSRRDLYLKLLPYFGAFAVVAVASTMAFAMLFSDKMPGPGARYRHNRYSYEFYNGPLLNGVPK